MEEKVISRQQPSETLSDSDVGHVLLAVDKKAERSYVRKLDLYLLPFLSLCYFFSAVDRVSITTARAQGYALVSDKAIEQCRQCENRRDGQRYELHRESVLVTHPPLQRTIRHHGFTIDAAYKTVFRENNASGSHRWLGFNGHRTSRSDKFRWYAPAPTLAGQFRGRFLLWSHLLHVTLLHSR